MQIPVDMVINCVITTIVVHSIHAPKNFIYHVSSSLRNPLRIDDFHNISYQYFMKNPYIIKNGKPRVYTKGIIFTSTVAFNMYMTIRCGIPLKVYFYTQRSNQANYMYFN